MKLDKTKPIDFYWFSGSGNTLSIVKAMAGLLREHGFTVGLKPIEYSDPAKVDIHKTIGFGIPAAAIVCDAFHTARKGP